MCDYVNKAEMAYAEQEQAGSVMGISPIRSGSPLREAQHEVKHLEDRLQNRKRGLEFLMKHPEFAEFIELQRSGSL